MAWHITDTAGRLTSRNRLYRLGTLTPPDPPAPGAARVAEAHERALLVDWAVAFSRELGEPEGEAAAGAVTTAVSRVALDAGATDVVLFTDLANPTSNALYQRLGFTPVDDRRTLEFAA